MYVWIDALSNYITILGYPDRDISDFWPATAQFVGKDILRFHAITWPAILLGLGLPLPRRIVTHGHVLADGQKMSKSIGNVINPIEVLERHGLDAFRYFFLRHIDTFADSDFTWEKFDAAYNNELANDLGNLVQRFATLCSKNNISKLPRELKLDTEFTALMDKFEFAKAFTLLWQRVQGINKSIDEQKPWELAKQGNKEQLEAVLNSLVGELLSVSALLAVFLPDTAAKIADIFSYDPSETSTASDSLDIQPTTPLFPKI